MTLLHRNCFRRAINSRSLQAAMYAMLSLLLTAYHTSASAEDAPPPPPDFIHSVPRPNELPAPGLPLRIEYTFGSSKTSPQSQQVFVVRDGKLLSVAPKSAPVGDGDELGYVVEVPSPLAEIRYQIFTRTKKGELLTSPQYAVRRSCIPNIALTSSEPVKGADARDQISKLIAQSNGLARDLQEYDEAIRLLESLSDIFGDKS